jgi:hypothetical protein
MPFLHGIMTVVEIVGGLTAFHLRHSTPGCVVFEPRDHLHARLDLRQLIARIPCPPLLISLAIELYLPINKQVQST